MSSQSEGVKDQKPLIISLMGPTAAGKTDLAIALCDELNAGIISVDSAMVYCGLDIGSAKPSAAELAKAPHRLINIREFYEPYSVADFCRDATREIDNLLAEGKTPLLVGGTMMYFKALIEGLSTMPAADEHVRAEIESQAKRFGWPHIHGQLAEVDPLSAEKIHPNHSQRLSRALEVFRTSGKQMSEFHGKLGGGLGERYRWQQFAIAPQRREVLHQRIATRFQTMLTSGFVEEVKTLRKRAEREGILLDEALPALRAVGYRQVWQYLEGQYDRSELESRGIAATRQLAKRQLTWLRGWQKLDWLYSEDEKGKSYSFSELINNALKILAERTI